FPAQGLAVGDHSVEARLDDLAVRAPLAIDADGPAGAVTRAGDGRPVTPELAPAPTDALLVAVAHPDGVAGPEVAAAPAARRPYAVPVPVASLAGPSFGVRATDRAGNVTLLALPLHLDRPPPVVPAPPAKPEPPQTVAVAEPPPEPPPVEPPP